MQWLQRNRVATFYPEKNYSLKPTFQNREDIGKMFCLEGMIAFCLSSPKRQNKQNSHLFLILSVQHETAAYLEDIVSRFYLLMSLFLPGFQFSCFTV